MKIKTVSLQPLRSKIISNKKDCITVTEVPALAKIKEIVTEFKPELVLELGTSWGGMTFLFQECLDSNTEIHSFDIKCPRVPDFSIFNKNVHFHQKDIITSPSSMLIDLCKRKEKKLLYCDNGHKIKEVILYGSQLNYGDMMGVHDWGKEIHTDYRKIKKFEQRCTMDEYEELVKVFNKFNNIKRFENSWFGTRRSIYETD